MVDANDLEKPALLYLLGNVVYQGSNIVNADLNLILALKREGVRWHNAGTCQQKTSIRKTLIAEEVFNQPQGISLQLGERGGRCKLYLAAPQNLHLNLSGAGHGLLLDKNSRA